MSVKITAAHTFYMNICVITMERWKSGHKSMLDILKDNSFDRWYTQYEIKDSIYTYTITTLNIYIYKRAN